MVKKILGSIAVFIATLVLAGVIMELFKTRKQEEARYFRTRNVFQYQPGNVRFDPVLGYITSANLDVPFNNEEFSTNIRTNHLGFRDDQNSVNNPDAIFLGDSYVWGWGVDEQEDVEKQFEQITHQKVLNAGVPGYGNVQELLLLYKLRGVMPLAGKRIFLFFCANDFIDNQNTSFGLFPYLKNENGRPVFSHPSAEGFEQWQKATDEWTIHSGLARRSMLWYDICAATKNIRLKDIYKDYETDNTRINGIQAFLMVVNELATLQQEEQALVSVVYIPPASYYDTGNPDQSLDIVKTTCSKLHMRFLDLSQGLSKDDYYPLDLHWKPSGHKKAAIFITSH